MGSYYGYSYCIYSDADKPALKITVENNIFNTSMPNDSQGNGSMIVLYNVNPSHYSCNYNLFFRTNKILRTHLLNGTSYYMSTLTNLPNSWEDNSPVPSNPMFVSENDLHLKSNSPAVGTGKKLDLPMDFDGNKWNNPPSIGAFEFNPNPINPDTTKKKGLVIYPNPSDGDLTILRQGSSLEYIDFKIVNLCGKTILNDFLEEGVSSKHFLMNINTGIYLILISQSHEQKGPGQKLIIIK
jgi:hypothetical protein